MERSWPEVEIERRFNTIYFCDYHHLTFVVNNIFPIEGEDYGRWASELLDYEIEAAIQMYYDRWNFESGNKFYKDVVDCLSKEKERRLKN